MPGGFMDQPVLTRLVPRFTLTTLLTLANPAHARLIMGDHPLQQNLDLLVSLAKLPAILQMIRLLGQANALPYAARVRCPVVFILGRRDIVFDYLPGMAERGELAALFPQAASVTTHLLDTATHNGFSTHSDDVAALTLDTLQKLEVRD
jgi:pimeloyl-ACP methyl ester carboxylesterase